MSDKKKSPATKRDVIGGRARKSDSVASKTRTSSQISEQPLVDASSRVESRQKITNPDLLRKALLAILITSLVFAIGIQVGESRNSS